MATGNKPKSKETKRKVSHIRITKAANGHSVEHHLEPMKSGKGKGAVMHYEEPPAPSVFSGAKAKEQMLDHVGKLADQMCD